MPVRYLLSLTLLLCIAAAAGLLRAGETLWVVVRSRAGAVANRSVSGPEVAMVAVGVVLVLVSGFALWRVLTGGDAAGERMALGLHPSPPGEGETVAGVQAPSPEPAEPPPTTTPTPAPPTATPTEPPATATPTATPTPSPTPQPPTPTPTPNPVTQMVEAGEAGWMSGRWQITDVVQEGPGRGQTFTIVVELYDVGGVIRGTGPEGLVLSGERSGSDVRLVFGPGGAHRGTFTWTVRADGTLAGTFTDGESRGISVAKRKL